MIAKVAFQKIRRIAKRGSNEMLQRAIEEVYAAGMEAGARLLSEQLKGRINDFQSAGNGNNPSGEQRQSDSTEPSQGGGVDAVDPDSSRGGTQPNPGPFPPQLGNLAD